MAFVTDTFTVASDTTLTSHTPDSGGTWTLKWDTTAGTVIASEDRVRGTSDSAPTLAYHSADPATAEYDVEAVARFVTGSNNGNPAIIARAAVAGSLRNYLFAYLTKAFSKALIQEVVNGAVPNQAEWTNTFAFDTDYALKLEVRDGSGACKFFIDGVQRAAITIGALTDKGKTGFSVRMNGRIDDFSAADLAAGVTIDCTPGAAVAAGVLAGVASPITVAGAVGSAVAAGATATVQTAAQINCGVGAAQAGGAQAAVSVSTVILCGVGNAVAAGVLSDVSVSGGIAAAVGNAVAAGQPAVVSSPVVVSCVVGDAVAAGVPAAVSVPGEIAAGVGAAVAAGVQASISAAQVIECAPGDAVAQGQPAGVSIATAGAIECAVGAAVAAGAAANIWTADIALPRTRRIGDSQLVARRGGVSLRAARRVGPAVLRRSA